MPALPLVDEREMLVRGAAAAQVDVEVRECVGAIHSRDLRDVEVGALQEVKLTFAVEVEQTLDAAVGADDAGGDCGVFGLGFEFLPVFVAAGW